MSPGQRSLCQSGLDVEATDIEEDRAVEHRGELLRLHVPETRGLGRSGRRTPRSPASSSRARDTRPLEIR
eukprot:11083206-Heterocapsa_arctica.AAC.2